MGLIANEIVSVVLERCDIVELIAGYVALKRAGRNFKALCPFHNEKSSSFVVSPDKQIFHCFGCGAGGNAIGFVMMQERLEFPEAVRFLADKVGVVIPESNPAQNQMAAVKQENLQLNELAVEYFHANLMTKNESEVQKAREYLKSRGLKLEIVQQFRLGFALDQWDGLYRYFKSKNFEVKLIERSGLVIPRENKEGYYDRFRDRIVFPIFDVKSQCVGFGARTMKDEKGAKYINSPDTPVYTKGHHLFGLQLARHAITKKDFAIVVEGYMDMILPFQYGVDNIVASLGTALTVEQIRLLRRYSSNVVMLFDADAAGQAAMIRSLDLLIEQDMNVRFASLSEGEDPDTFIRKYGIDVFNERIQSAVAFFDFKLQWLKQQFDVNKIEHRAEICNQMMATIYKISNEVVRFGYLKQLAQQLQIPEQVLLKEGRKIEAVMIKKQPPVVKAVVENKTAKSLNAVEQQLVGLVIHDFSLFAVVKEKIQPDEFEDKRTQQIFEALLKMGVDVESFTVARLITYCPDPQLQKIILSLSAQEIVLGKDRLKIVMDCITRIKHDRLKTRRKNISELIRLAEETGDLSQLESLKEEFNRLVKSRM